MNTHVVVPARMASTRLPEKPLADINGLPMIVRVAQQVAKADVTSVTVAVDHEQVYAAVEAAGIAVMMTRQEHPSGSDRVLEVVDRQPWQDADVVINVQGDEPLIPAAVVNFLARTMQQDAHISMATLAEPITRVEDFYDPNVVKVVCDDHQDALYFSRAPVPFPRDLSSGESTSGESTSGENVPPGALRHVGVYAFRVSALRQFVDMRNSRLESIERLEQLRWLESGRKLRVLVSPEPVPGGVDTREDLQRVRAMLSRSG